MIINIVFAYQFLTSFNTFSTSWYLQSKEIKTIGFCVGKRERGHRIRVKGSTSSIGRGGVDDMVGG